MRQFLINIAIGSLISTALFSLSWLATGLQNSFADVIMYNLWFIGLTIIAAFILKEEQRQEEVE